MGLQALHPNLLAGLASLKTLYSTVCVSITPFILMFVLAFSNLENNIIFAASLHSNLFANMPNLTAL
jgi:hypothetical protein